MRLSMASIAIARFRFRLQTLLAVVSFAGLLLGWATYYLNWIHERRTTIVELENAGAMILRDDLFPASAKQQLPWGLRILGENGFVQISVWPEIGEGDQAYNKRINHLRHLFPEADGLEAWPPRSH